MSFKTTIKQEIKPFLKEWKELSKGIYKKVHVGPYKFKVFFYWEEDNIPTYEIQGIYGNRYGDGILMERVIPDSKAYRDFKNRINAFVERVSDYGEKYHKNRDYLWEEYFWKYE